jgi:hypothetical protein
VNNNTLSILVHAASKEGKSTLGSTMPPPICVLDVEGSWRFIRRAGYCVQGIHNTEKCTCDVRRSIEWDPNQGPPPRWDGSWEICHVTVREWRTLTNAYNWLTQAPHDFTSLCFDSITEAQRRLKANLRGLEQMRMQDWGDLLVQMDKLIRDYRDLVLLPSTTMRVVMFIAETKNINGKWRPYMQGAIGDSLPYWLDIVGYLYTEYVPDENNQNTVEVKKLWIGKHPQFEAGERVQGMLGNVVERPNVADMLARIFGDVPSPKAEIGTKKEG